MNYRLFALVFLSLCSATEAFEEPIENLASVHAAATVVHPQLIKSEGIASEKCFEESLNVHECNKLAFLEEEMDDYIREQGQDPELQGKTLRLYAPGYDVDKHHERCRQNLQKCLVWVDKHYKDPKPYREGETRQELQQSIDTSKYRSYYEAYCQSAFKLEYRGEPIVSFCVTPGYADCILQSILPEVNDQQIKKCLEKSCKEFAIANKWEGGFERGGWGPWGCDKYIVSGLLSDSVYRCCLKHPPTHPPVSVEPESVEESTESPSMVWADLEEVQKLVEELAKEPQVIDKPTPEDFNLEPQSDEDFTETPPKEWVTLADLVDIQEDSPPEKQSVFEPGEEIMWPVPGKTPRPYDNDNNKQPSLVVALSIASGLLALAGGLFWYFRGHSVSMSPVPGTTTETSSTNHEGEDYLSSKRSEQLTDPKTGEPLIEAEDGRYWVEGQWTTGDEALRWHAEQEQQLKQEREEIDRKMERWQEEDYVRREQKLREDNMVYDRESDSWQPGEEHPETIAEHRREELERVRTFIRGKVKDPLRSEFLDDLADRVYENGGDLERLHKAVLNQEWHAKQMREANKNLDAADWFEAAENTAKTTRDTAQLANRTMGKFVPGAGYVVSTAQGVITGFVAGYSEGGWGDALTAGGARAWDLTVERYTGIPGMGTAMRQAAGSGYTHDEGGQLTSPLDRFAEHWMKNISDQYDPREWAKSMIEARQRWREGQYVQAVRDAGNVVLDAWDAGSDISSGVRKATRLVERAREAGIRIDYGQEVSPKSGRKAVVPEEADISYSLKGRARKMADGVTKLDDGHFARLDDVLEVQRSTRATRSLKNADVPEYIREGFNNTLRKRVYQPHDEELLRHVKDNVSGMKNKRLRIHDFRTPGKGDSAINTDRDYRLQYQDEDGNWHEVKKELWENKSRDLFAKYTHYDADKARSMLGNDAERAAWDKMSNAERKIKWGEMHAQTPTDKFHIEASRDYSDQKLTDRGQRVTGESNILRVKRGEAILEDARGLADMYKVKTDLELQRGNRAEAIAQMKKTADTLEHVREGYGKQRFEIGEMPNSMRQAMDVVKNAHVDERADIVYIGEIEAQLKDLGFQGIGDLNDKMCNQIEGMKFARPKEPSGPAFSTNIWRSAYKGEPPTSLVNLPPEETSELLHS